jgi:hypothetical protein
VSAVETRTPRDGTSDVPLDADDEDQLGLSGDVERAILLGNAGKADLLALGIAVLLDVLLSTLKDDAALLLVGLPVTSAKLWVTSCAYCKVSPIA